MPDLIVLVDRPGPDSGQFTNEEYLSRWADADKYLATLRAGADTGLLDLSILQIDKYEEALRQSMTRSRP